MKPVILAAVTLTVTAAGFAAGRLSAQQINQPRAAAITGFVMTQNSSPAAPNPAPQQAPNDPRELIPLGPQSGQQPGQRPGQQPGQQPAQCPVQIYQDGKLYTFPQPGQQPGQGNGSQPGQPGQPQELIPLGPGAGGGTTSPSPSTPPATPPVNPKTRS